MLEDQAFLPLEVHAQTELELRAAEVGNHVVGVLERLCTDGQVQLGSVILLKYVSEINVVFIDCLLRVELGNETNPTPGETSSYGRCMSVVTVSSAESIPGIKNVSMNYHNGYVTARVDAETNRIVRCEFSAAADVQATVTILGDISVSNIVSTETFTDFVW